MEENTKDPREAEWLILREGKEWPVTEVQLKRLASTGKLLAGDQVKRKGVARWSAVSALPTLLAGAGEAVPTKPGEPLVPCWPAEEETRLQASPAPTSRRESHAGEKPIRKKHDKKGNRSSAGRGAADEVGRPPWMGRGILGGLAILAGLGIVGGILAVLKNRPAQVPDSAPLPPFAKPNPKVEIPDFSKVDYSVDIAKVDYSKGPEGQALFEWHGIAYGGGPMIAQGFVDWKRPKPISLTRNMQVHTATTLGLGATQPLACLFPAAATAVDTHFVSHGRLTVFYPPPKSKPDQRENLPRMYEQYRFNGMRHGPNAGWFPNGQMEIQVAFKNEKQHGLLEKWTPEGKKVVEEYYLDGKLHGLQKHWRPDGQLSLEGAWVMDVRQGPFKQWDQKGDLRETHWLHGVFDRGKNNRQGFIRALNLTANGRSLEGKLTYRDIGTFSTLFGTPNAVKVQSRSPVPSLNQNDPLFQTNVPGGQEWYYDCSDGTIGVRIESDNRGACVIHATIQIN